LTLGTTTGDEANRADYPPAPVAGDNVNAYDVAPILLERLCCSRLRRFADAAYWVPGQPTYSGLVDPLDPFP
jgi:hypothetical protein